MHSQYWTRRVLLSCAGICLMLFGVTPVAMAKQSESWPAGDEIVQRVNTRDEGEAVSRTLVMELINSRGNKRVRETRTFRKNAGAERRTVIFYLGPKNVKGTAFLTFDHPSQEDYQWLYLPALQKTRRISAANRGDYFLGTDFTYEDVKLDTKISGVDYAWKTVGEELVDDHPCYVLEGIPVNDHVAKELGYSRLLTWIDRDIWIARRVEYWDVQGNPLKQILLQDIRQVQGIWTVHQLAAHNYKTDHRTVFLFRDVDYKGRVDDDLFTERALRRGF